MLNAGIAKLRKAILGNSASDAGADSLRKGVTGAERPGHKYLKREPKAGGGNKYTYQEPGVMSQGDAVAGSLEDIASNWSGGFGAYGSNQATETISKQVRNIEGRFPNLTPLETRMLRTTEGKVRGALQGKKSEHDIHIEVLGIIAHAAHAIRGFKVVKAPAANKGLEALRDMNKALRGSEKPGHKYTKREAKAAGYKYTYADQKRLANIIHRSGDDAADLKAAKDWNKKIRADNKAADAAALLRNPAPTEPVEIQKEILEPIVEVAPLPGIAKLRAAVGVKVTTPAGMAWDAGEKAGKTDGWMFGDKASVYSTLEESADRTDDPMELVQLWQDGWKETDHYNLLHRRGVVANISSQQNFDESVNAGEAAAEAFSAVEDDWWEGAMTGLNSRGIDVYKMARKILAKKSK